MEARLPIAAFPGAAKVQNPYVFTEHPAEEDRARRDDYSQSSRAAQRDLARAHRGFAAGLR